MVSLKTISDNIIDKDVDKSTFRHRGTRITTPFYNFFDLHVITRSTEYPIVLLYGNKTFGATIKDSNEKDSGIKMRLLWHNDFKEVLDAMKPLKIRFVKTDIPYAYIIKLIETNTIVR
jgi:endonuclease V-like protein UPF0215 family